MNEDPVKDAKGSGILGLRGFVYFATNYPDEVQFTWGGGVTGWTGGRVCGSRICDQHVCVCGSHARARTRPHTPAHARTHTLPASASV